MRAQAAGRAAELAKGAVIATLAIGILGTPASAQAVEAASGYIVATKRALPKAPLTPNAATDAGAPAADGRKPGAIILPAPTGSPQAAVDRAMQQRAKAGSAGDASASQPKTTAAYVPGTVEAAAASLSTYGGLPGGEPAY